MKKLLVLPFLICLYFHTISSQTSGNWVTVVSFTGTGNETTDDFYIKSSKWRAIWTVEKQNPEWGVHFAASVYKGEDMLEMMGNVMKEATGKSVFRSKGSHYIKVICVMAQWKIEIQEFRAK